MARRTGKDRTLVFTTGNKVNLGDAAGDVDTGMVCPGDGATVVRVIYTMSTAGTGTQNHNLDLEHGAGSAGVAMTGTVDVLADATAGTIVKADGLDRSAQPATVEGTLIQIKNVEEGAISDGAILNVGILWQL